MGLATVRLLQYSSNVPSMMRRMVISPMSNKPRVMSSSIVRSIALTTLLIPGLSAAQQGSSRDVENGKRLFVKNGCYECHGYVGQGGFSGPRIAPWTLGADAVVAYLRHPSGQMPPYTAKVMSDREIIDVAAYLKSIPNPNPAATPPGR